MEDWHKALDTHEADRYAHPPILLSLQAEITDLQKLGWMVRGGLVTISAIVGGSLLLLLLHVQGIL